MNKKECFCLKCHFFVITLQFVKNKVCKIRDKRKMELVLDILKYTIPALLVFLTAYYMLKTVIRNEKNKQLAELKTESYKVILPVRLQAYERMALFLERISADSLIVRTQQKNLTVKQYQLLLISNIRTEFEHNIAQQIYIGAETWNVIKSAKENMIKLVNTCAEDLKPDAPSLLLSKTILETVMSLEDQPVQVALLFLKKEMRQFF